ncbi:unnamed protein product [Mytilus edulis]|uniref:Uncharacterized protein n=1 Tax=Mytilus edulis TaxID=6550 RepID=A0A8S3TR29_MYTED|nr:unnamed protein product [Mytilus edulis]
MQNEHRAWFIFSPFSAIETQCLNDLCYILFKYYEVSDSTGVQSITEVSDSTVLVTDIPTISDYTTVKTDISPTPCYMYETLNETNIYNETEFVTQYITVPVSVSTFVPNLQTVTTTINVTETVYVNNSVIDTNNPSPNGCLDASQPYLSPDDPVLHEAIASMSKELKVDKKKTNSHIRKLTSASDSRMSSRTIGIFGIVLLIIPFFLIILGDIPAVWRDTSIFLGDVGHKKVKDRNSLFL